MRIYLIGCLIGAILSFINYMLFLSENEIKDNLNKYLGLFINVLFISLCSWYGVICCVGSIYSRLKK